MRYANTNKHTVGVIIQQFKGVCSEIQIFGTLLFVQVADMVTFPSNINGGELQILDVSNLFCDVEVSCVIKFESRLQTSREINVHV